MNQSTSIIIDRKINTHNGFFGEFGGAYVSSRLKAALDEVTYGFKEALTDNGFLNELLHYQKNYIGRPSPLYFAKELTQQCGGAKIFLKREDLNHTGSHKINNAIGQALLAKRMAKKRLIAETGAGQHGVATATVAALLSLPCTIYMGEVDCQRQAHNVLRMKMLGAEVVAVKTGSATLKDAIEQALLDFSENNHEAFYLMGSAVGPHPYPLIVRTFQSVIGAEAKVQMVATTGKSPDAIVAAVGGGSNAIGAFYAFLEDKTVALYGVEPAGKGLKTKQHAAAICKGKSGIIHGFKCMALLDKNGDVQPVHSIAAGLDYPGVGPEHSYLHHIKRATYVSVTDEQALSAFYTLTKTEGIIPALESAHAVAYGITLAKKLNANRVILINLSGSGDKDTDQVLKIKPL